MFHHLDEENKTIENTDFHYILDIKSYNVLNIEKYIKSNDVYTPLLNSHNTIKKFTNVVEVNRKVFDSFDDKIDFIDITFKDKKKSEFVKSLYLTTESKMTFKEFIKNVIYIEIYSNNDLLSVKSGSEIESFFYNIYNNVYDMFPIFEKSLTTCFKSTNFRVKIYLYEPIKTKAYANYIIPPPIEFNKFNRDCRVTDIDLQSSISKLFLFKNKKYTISLPKIYAYSILIKSTINKDGDHASLSGKLTINHSIHERNNDDDYNIVDEYLIDEYYSNKIHRHDNEYLPENAYLIKFSPINLLKDPHISTKFGCVNLTGSLLELNTSMDTYIEIIIFYPDYINVYGDGDTINESNIIEHKNNELLSFEVRDISLTDDSRFGVFNLLGYSNVCKKFYDSYTKDGDGFLEKRKSINDIHKTLNDILNSDRIDFDDEINKTLKNDILKAIEICNSKHKDEVIFNELYTLIHGRYITNNDINELNNIIERKWYDNLFNFFNNVLNGSIFDYLLKNFNDIFNDIIYNIESVSGIFIYKYRGLFYVIYIGIIGYISFDAIYTKLTK
jgi:hypothetical protein